MILLGSKVNKPFKIFDQTWNAAEYFELDIKNIEAPRKNDLII